MYFSLIRLRRDISPKEVAALGRNDDYGLHKLVWGLFSDGPERRRDFLYRFEKVKGLPTFYTVSNREPEDFAGLWDIHPKPYTPKLKNGDRLSFAVRVNPIRSKREENGRQCRHDVVMEAKTRIDFKNLPDVQRPLVATIIQEAGLEWLKSRESELGFNASDSGVRADGYFQHTLFKGKGTKPVKFSTLEFNGILSVTDPDVFIEKCLFNGIGPAKGFGCGLMLVRRV
jgi:CRISPR system Cascade subunit CasE